MPEWNILRDTADHTQKEKPEWCQCSRLSSINSSRLQETTQHCWLPKAEMLLTFWLPKCLEQCAIYPKLHCWRLCLVTHRWHARWPQHFAWHLGDSRLCWAALIE